MLNVRSHSSLLLVIMLPPPLIPALLNSKWILSVWWRSATSSRNRSTCVRLATSTMCVVTRSPCGNPAASHSLCVSAWPVGETSHIATLQASATSWRTSSRPIPLPPPVTTAVLPANSVMCTSLAFRGRSRYGLRLPLRWWGGAAWDNVRQANASRPRAQTARRNRHRRRARATGGPVHRSYGRRVAAGDNRDPARELLHVCSPLGHEARAVRTRIMSRGSRPVAERLLDALRGATHR